MFWIKNTWDERTALEWNNLESMLSPEVRGRRIEAMREGSKGHDLWPELDVRPEPGAIVETLHGVRACVEHSGPLYDVPAGVRPVRTSQSAGQHPRDGVVA